MSNSWPQTRLGDHASLLVGFAFKSSGFTETGPGIRLVRGDNVTEGSLRWGEKTRYWPNCTAELRRYLLRPGDIVIGMDGSKVGRNWAIVRKSDLPLLLVQRVACLRASESLDQRFLAVLIRSESFKKYVDAIQTGSSIPHISGGQIADFAFNIPPISEQQAIGKLLGVIDDKIEINRWMNETLEAMALAIFKSWFIDFDPVRAKMEGRSIGLSPEIEAHFPNSFQESQLGKMPKGWSSQPLPKVIQINPIRTLAKNQSAPYLDMKNMPTQGPRPSEWVLRTFGSGVKFINGDTLIARITPCLENGKTAFVDFLQEGEVGWGSTEYIVIRPLAPLPLEYGYFLARNEDFRSFAIQNMTGSSGRQRVPPDCFSKYHLAIPPADVAKQFGKVISPMMKLISKHGEQSTTLTAIRDTLLPKLLSGEIRVKDTEKVVGAVV